MDDRFSMYATTRSLSVRFAQGVFSEIGSLVARTKKGESRMRWKLSVVILALAAISCSGSGTSPESRVFNLKFSYGKNVLNTFQNTYTKDLILDGTTTVPFALSNGELDRVDAKMREIDFFIYPEHFAVTIGDTVGIITPHSTYDFQVNYKSTTKHLHWSDSVLSDDTAAVKLRELVLLIRSIVESKPEYSQLPPARGGYL
jgi:hypothetical protein